MKADTMVDAASSRFDTAYIWIVSSVAALGGLLFGYDWVVIGGAKPFYEKFFQLTTPAQQGGAMSCALVGCLAGASLSGGLSDRLGRKRLLIFSGLVFAVSSLATAMAPTFRLFVLWRIMGGLAIGLASSLSPMYIAEVAPAAFRGKLVSLNQLTIVIGILLAQLMNWLIAEPVPNDATALQILHSWNGQVGWRWMFGVTAIPSVLFFAAMFFVPESPRWLAKNGAWGKAPSVLARTGGRVHAVHALDEIRATLTASPGKAGFRMLLSPKVTKVLFLGVVL